MFPQHTTQIILDLVPFIVRLLIEITLVLIFISYKLVHSLACYSSDRRHSESQSVTWASYTMVHGWT